MYRFSSNSTDKRNLQANWRVTQLNRVECAFPRATQRRSYRDKHGISAIRHERLLLSTRASNAWTATPNYRSSYTYDGNGNIKSLVRVDSAGTLMDSLIYRYQTNKNRLTHVDDPGGVASNHSFDVDDQATRPCPNLS